MNGRHFSFGASGNPLAQLVSLLVFGAVLAAAVIMGAFVLLAVLGLAVIGFLAFTVRGWWLRRQQRGRGPNDDGPGPGRPAKGIRYIEGEYEVIDSSAERRGSGERR